MSEEQKSAPRFTLRGQYTKDLSFENPNAPASLMQSDAQPKVDMNFDMSGSKIDQNMYELVMSFNIRTSTEKTMFIVELSYAGIFEIANIEEDKIQQVLMVDCAFILLPFARRVIADVTRDGGFAPMLVEPIDFYGLFMRKHQQEAG